MSNHAWSLSPKFARRPKSMGYTSVPQNYKVFLHSKIPPVPRTNEQERDFVIRRAMALYRLCWCKVPGGWNLLDQRMREVFGSDWRVEFRLRTGDDIEIPNDEDEIDF